jgi:hypothetical protein
MVRDNVAVPVLGCLAPSVIVRDKWMIEFSFTDAGGGKHQVKMTHEQFLRVFGAFTQLRDALYSIKVK